MEPLHAMVHGWCCTENERLTKELKQLQRDNEVLYRDNVVISETADRLREALEKIAAGDLFDQWACENIARAALKVKP